MRPVNEDVELDGVPFQNFLFEVRDLVKELTGKKRLTSGDVFWSAVDAWERNRESDRSQDHITPHHVESH